ncbi:methyltransferase [Alteraurantiacibacter aquimixticola]|uniref:Methyltransferase domain-containing protein n=1 Tax=Alteraurantiacibacter aquimixticola TaxID=2489173 RepID=A0A4T3F684_9SPHN|nr:class I SAM-dependent methyltransferase [Alteraurantiacibacter aquimixticola]TIX51162.1 methyltransferase domain-containing protein [Alteraurantiacibacter aquimixticola]
MGCGAGAILLHLARGAAIAVGTDINPRAGAFLVLNARLNGFDNVEFRCGDLFAPVAGERFDLLVSQPPFMPTPPAASPAVFRDGGARGDGLWRKVVAGAPDHLTEGGVAVIVGEIGGGISGHLSQAGGEPRDGCQSLCLIGQPVSAEEYAIRASIGALKHGYARYRGDVRMLLRHLRACGLDLLAPLVLTIRRTAQAGGWTLRSDKDVWEDFDLDHALRHIDARLALEESASTTSFVAAADLAAATLIRYRSVGAGDGRDESAHLHLPRGALRRGLEMPLAEWDALEALGGGIELRHEGDWRPVDAAGRGEPGAAVAGAMTRLFEAGLLVVQERAPLAPAPAAVSAGQGGD